jgi:hypothetical protein
MKLIEFNVSNIQYGNGRHILNKDFWDNPEELGKLIISTLRSKDMNYVGAKIEIATNHTEIGLNESD